MRSIGKLFDLFLILALYMQHAVAWSLFFSNEAKTPWKDAFAAVDEDGDGFLVVQDLELLLRDHFRKTEPESDNKHMILANEQIFRDQAEEVADFFGKEGKFHMLVGGKFAP